MEVRGQLYELVLSFYLYRGPRGQTQVIRLVHQSPLPKAWDLNPGLVGPKACTTNRSAKTPPNKNHGRDGKKCKERSELLPRELHVLEHHGGKKTATMTAVTAAALLLPFANEVCRYGGRQLA